MILSGTNYRDIYYQSSGLVFDFNISNYDSQNFQVGLLGDKFLGLIFKTGLIYDWQTNLVGAYNGKPISFNSSRRGGVVEYSINGVPINRNVASSATYEKIVAYMYDSGVIDLTTNLKGDVPTISFANMVSNSGVSGQILNHGVKSIKLFDLTSNDFTGAWTFDNVISAGGTGNFYIRSANTMVSGDTIDLSLFANYGNNTYQVPVSSLISGSGDPEAYSFGSLALVSGNNRINNTGQNFIYAVSYLSSTNYLNLYFDYTQNRTGDAYVTKSGNTTGTYSGWLTAISGLCSGTLYNTSSTVSSSSYTLDAYNTKNVNFYTPSEATYSAYATGRYVYSYNYYEDLINGINRTLPNAIMQSGQYMTDLGGYFGNSLVSGETYDLWLQNSSYTGARLLTGVINSQSFSGKYVFNSDYYIATGLFKREQALGSGYTGQLFDGRLYRGIAYCFLPDNYSLQVTGYVAGNSAYVMTGVLNSNYNTLLYKDVPNSSGSGQYIFSGLISGKILVKEYGYYIGSGSFGLDEAPAGQPYGYTDFYFHRHFLRQGMEKYDRDNLNPFSGITGYLSNLYAGLAGTPASEFIKTGYKPINFNSQGFIAHPAKKANGQFYSQNLRYLPPDQGVAPIYYRVVEAEFTGQLPTPITGYIQRGDFRYYLKSGNRSGLFLENTITDYNIPADQAHKTDINNLYSYEFNGEDQLQIAKKYIIGPATGVNQVIDPPFTGYLDSGYFSATIITTGQTTGVFHDFAKNMPDVWQVGVGDTIDGPYQSINIPPFIESASRYKMPNILINGDSEKYISVSYTAKNYTDISGGSDRAELSFTLNSASGTQIIE